MVPTVRVDADLEVTVTLPDGGTARSRLHGSGRRLRFEVDRPELFAARSDVAALVGVADLLARRGLILDVVHQGSVILTLGARNVPWWHRRLTASGHIRLHGWRSLLVPGRARLRRSQRDEGVLPVAVLVPPPTLFPIAPTFGRQAWRVTTTHDPSRGGRPRLVLGSDEVLPDYDPHPRIHWLKDGTTRIGSAEDCDLQLDGLDALHAEVVHDLDDELVVIAHRPDVRVNGVPIITRQVLRTGSRLHIGGWMFVYARDEYADHGRPYGGRVGGEAGHQRTQPPRPPSQAPQS